MWIILSIQLSLHNPHPVRGFNVVDCVGFYEYVDSYVLLLFYMPFPLICAVYMIPIVTVIIRLSMVGVQQFAPPIFIETIFVYQMKCETRNIESNVRPRQLCHAEKTQQ